jgi:hypothetical protein
MFAGFPGISCLATFISSLRDKGWRPYFMPYPMVTQIRGRGKVTLRGVDFVGLASEAALQTKTRIARPNLPA